jgi:hypothetical protein
MSYGLNIPPAWRVPVSWWVIKYAPRCYIRWTWPRWLFPRWVKAHGGHR